MNALFTSFRQTLRSLRLVWLLYGITLALGLLAAIPFYNTLIAEDQNSLAFLNLLNGFDYTVFSDFMHRSGRTLSPLISVGRWLGVLYIFLSLFFAGGILVHFSQSSATGLPARLTTGLFWQACSHYAGRFLRLFGVTLLFVLIGGGIWLIAGSLASIMLSDTFTERGLFWIGAVFFGLFMLTATLALCIGDYAKVLMFREDERNAFRAFGRAGRLVMRNPGRTLGYYWLLILIGTGLFGIYFLIDGAVSMSGWVTILFLFVVQQALIFARIALKVWSLGVTYTVNELLPKPVPVVKTTAPPVADPVYKSAPADEPEPDDEQALPAGS